MLFFVKIVTSNMDPFITQITTDCFMPFGNCFLTYITWGLNHCCSDGLKQDFQCDRVGIFVCFYCTILISWFVFCKINFAQT